jgi:hypothetical protein
LKELMSAAGEDLSTGPCGFQVLGCDTLIQAYCAAVSVAAYAETEARAFDDEAAGLET